MAVTLKLAVAGAVTVWLVGWAVKLGTVLTVKVTALLVTDPTPFVTTHSYCAPLLLKVVAPVVYEALVAPLIAVHPLPVLIFH